MIKRKKEGVRQCCLTDEIRRDELAGYFKVSCQTIYNWVKSKKLKSRKIIDILTIVGKN